MERCPACGYEFKVTDNFSYCPQCFAVRSFNPENQYNPNIQNPYGQYGCNQNPYGQSYVQGGTYSAPPPKKNKATFAVIGVILMFAAIGFADAASERRNSNQTYQEEYSSDEEQNSENHRNNYKYASVKRSQKVSLGEEAEFFDSDNLYWFGFELDEITVEDYTKDFNSWSDYFFDDYEFYIEDSDFEGFDGFYLLRTEPEYYCYSDYETFFEEATFNYISEDGTKFECKYLDYFDYDDMDAFYFVIPSNNAQEVALTFELSNDMGETASVEIEFEADEIDY